jgi:hypothetical protein
LESGIDSCCWIMKMERMTVGSFLERLDHGLTDRLALEVMQGLCLLPIPELLYKAYLALAPIKTLRHDDS